MNKVVVVEDEELVRKGLVLTTSWADYRCEVIGEATNGLEGVEMILKLKPDIVITDVNMSGLDGIEMIRQVMNQVDLACIIISGYSEFEYARQAVKLGVKDYLMKPIDDEDLHQALLRVCEEVNQKHKMHHIQNRLESLEENKLIFFKEYFSENDADGKTDYIARAIQYIQNHYMEDLAIKEVADFLHLSEGYLSKLFKNETGYTFVDYLTNYRMKKACKLLTVPTVKIYEIAEQVGYKDQRYFSLLFKKITGMTPKEFKERKVSINKESV
ncbi:MAG TPA: response regulator [Bacillota bacterium]|nr:response regulator [Bacillota bacterium]